jgi:uncharacterized cupin superfamily protein
MKKPILNVADTVVESGSHGDHFQYSVRPLAEAIGGKAIGANVTTVPPGKAAFPLHHHRANEEHFFILSGTGVLRVGRDTYPVRAHDYIVNLPGSADLAHQLINTGTEEMTYLAISTTSLPEVVGYPDSGKTGVRIAFTADADARFLVEDASKPRLDYWEGEDGESVAAIVHGARG